jgi:hypothetical protein
VSIVNQFLKELGAGSNLKDYQHASKIFVDDNYRLAPKYAFLFHVSFDINPEITNLGRDHALEMGMLVKSANLPKFTVETKTYNAYNRPNIVQNRIKYDPLTIVFHDDNADMVRNFWYDYMNYYYRDSDYNYNGTSPYLTQHKYRERMSQQWGYQPAKYDSNQSERYLNAIRLYSLHQRKFTEYVLVNPTITNFQHGEHDNSRTGEVMQHTMTVQFETVLYSYGYIDPDNNINFATLHYDKAPSPLTPQGGGTNSILGPGGLLSAVDGTVNALGQGNLLGAGLTAFKSFENFKGKNLAKTATLELQRLGRDILNGTNPLNKIQIPSLGGLINSGGVSNSGPQVFGLAKLRSATTGQINGPASPSGANDGQLSGSLTSSPVQYESRIQALASQSFTSGVGSDYQNVVNSNGEGVATAYKIPPSNITTYPITSGTIGQGEN